MKMSSRQRNVIEGEKSDESKSLSKINKYILEKQRRTEMNKFIEELAEMVPLNKISSKVEKNQILQAVSDQLRLSRRNAENTRISHIASQDDINAILFEAIDGFLFTLDFDGYVKCVSANVNKYLNFAEKDFVGKNIYTVIHYNDFNSFSPIFSTIMDESTGESWPQTRNSTFHCRFLVRTPEREIMFKPMQVCCSHLLNDINVESSGRASDYRDKNYIMCFARSVSNTNTSNPIIEQFSMRLYPDGKIMGVDFNLVSSKYNKYLSKDMIGKMILDLCHPQDVNDLAVFLKDTLELGSATSSTCRLCVAPYTFLNVLFRSRFFGISPGEKNLNSTPPQINHDFMMVTVTIIGLQEEEPSQIVDHLTMETAIAMLKSEEPCNREHLEEHDANVSISENGNNVVCGSSILKDVKNAMQLQEMIVDEADSAQVDNQGFFDGVLEPDLAKVLEEFIENEFATHRY